MDISGERRAGLRVNPNPYFISILLSNPSILRVGKCLFGKVGANKEAGLEAWSRPGLRIEG